MSNRIVNYYFEFFYEGFYYQVKEITDGYYLRVKRIGHRPDEFRIYHPIMYDYIFQNYPLILYLLVKEFEKLKSICFDDMDQLEKDDILYSIFIEYDKDVVFDLLELLTNTQKRVLF